MQGGVLPRRGPWVWPGRVCGRRQVVADSSGLIGCCDVQDLCQVRGSQAVEPQAERGGGCTGVGGGRGRGMVSSIIPPWDDDDDLVQSRAGHRRSSCVGSGRRFVRLPSFCTMKTRGMTRPAPAGRQSRKRCDPVEAK